MYDPKDEIPEEDGGGEAWDIDDPTQEPYPED